MLIKDKEKIWVLGYIDENGGPVIIVNISLLLDRKLSLDRRVLPQDEVDYLIRAIDTAYKCLGSHVQGNSIQDIIVFREEEILIRPTRTGGGDNTLYYLIYRNINNGSWTTPQHSFSSEENIGITISM